MVHERVPGQPARTTTTHGAALPGAPAGWSLGPATPATPSAPSGQVASSTGPQASRHEPAQPPHHARPSSAPAPHASAPDAATPRPSTAPAVPEDVPPAERPLDPRAIARASLEASRNASLWWTAAGVALACVVALVAGTPAGAWTLSALLAAGAGVRAVRPEPGPVAWTVRGRALDVTVMTFLAVSIAVLAVILPTPEG
ncbi:DUF3017 domain-containing protein [Cellulomonas palmilytica]|uniref:DUF3017 domain-containing protein n=1 Tax=Cellulomonas palmilytica TaxID=2608402 RepID=UPI001F29EC75|nr:DUF3017 domain-containing protein [Cellulomonas palmilytica]